MFPTRIKALRACVRVRRVMGRDLRFRVLARGRHGWQAVVYGRDGRYIGFV